MSVTLKDKAVLIAGATSEIGKQVTAELLAAGARCEITFHSDAALGELFAFLKGRGLPAFGQPLIPIKLNNFNQSQVIWGPVAAQRDFGRLELMVNLLDTQLETRELDSVRKLTETALPLMKKRGFGRIVHVSPDRKALTSLAVEKEGDVLVTGIDPGTENAKPEAIAKKVMEFLGIAAKSPVTQEVQPAGPLTSA